MMKLGKDTGSLVNHLLSQVVAEPPKVGDGATVLRWTDRHAGTVIEVRPNGSFVVQADTCTRAASARARSARTASRTAPRSCSACAANHDFSF